MANPASLLEQTTLYILALMELCGLKKEDWTKAEYKPSTFSPLSRINLCFYTILEKKRRVQTRCTNCGFSDESSSDISDCFHYPYTHKLASNKTRVPHELLATNIVLSRYPEMTPILVTEGRTDPLPPSLLQISCPGIGLREVIRKVYKILLLTSFQPGPLVVISAGAADLKCNAPHLKLWEDKLERNRKAFFEDYFQPLDELIHFARSLNGDVIMSTFIPNPPDHDPGCGYTTANRGKTMARKLFFQINYEILRRNRLSLYKDKGLLNPAKYFYGKPSRRELYKDELGKVIPFYKINKKSYIKNSTSPTKRLSYTKNFLLVSTALKIAGWGRFSHEDYDTLLKECNLHNLTKERTGIEVVENITQ